MTPGQYLRIKAKLGLTHPHLAALIGVKRRQSLRYANGQQPIPKCTGIVLNLLAQGKITEKEIGT